MKSPGHRANILHGGYRYIGVGIQEQGGLCLGHTELWGDLGSRRHTMKTVLIGWTAAVLIQFAIITVVGPGTISPMRAVPGLDIAFVARDGRIEWDEWLWLISLAVFPFTAGLAHWVGTRESAGIGSHGAV